MAETDKTNNYHAVEELHCHSFTQSAGSLEGSLSSSPSHKHALHSHREEIEHYPRL